MNPPPPPHTHTHTHTHTHPGKYSDDLIIFSNPFISIVLFYVVVRACLFCFCYSKGCPSLGKKKKKKRGEKHTRL